MLWSPTFVHFAQPDLLLTLWMSSPACGYRDFPVLLDPASVLTAERFTYIQASGNIVGGSVPANHAPTAASRYSNTDRPCCVQVAITVQIRSHQ